MPIILFFVVFGGAVAVAVLYPHLRAQAGIVLALLGGLLAWVVVDQLLLDEPEPPVAREDLSLAEVVLTEGPRFVRVSGRVTNDADGARLREFTLAVTLRDCPSADAAPEACEVVAEDSGIARVDVPPGQTQAFEAILGFTERSEIRGVPSWDYRITAVRGTEVSRP